jgi:proteasome beta subunit
MPLPVFNFAEDPGSSFSELLHRVGLNPDYSAIGQDHKVPHATTCVAVRFHGGIVMGGDRRATAGNLISHRSMEKVVQADQFSAVAIAGAAGPAMEMVKVFQLSLEHYEKVEGKLLSLEGKANLLSTMIRQNLSAAMQGLVVVPIFGGYDTRRSEGRIWNFDVTGGRYEETEYVATGSGSVHCSTVLKMGWKENLSIDEAVKLVCRSLWEAADVDSATGGPDIRRGIYPVVAEISAQGWSRVSDDRLRAAFDAINAEVGAR